MTCERASSMPTQAKHKTFTAKTAAPLFMLKDIRRWLIDNCKNRWSATDYKGNDFNWRKLSKLKPVDFSSLNEEYDITLMVHFKKPEDLMLYMLSWPSEVLLKN